MSRAASAGGGATLPPLAGPPRPRVRVPRWLLPAGTLLAVLALGEALSRTGVLDPAYFPPPTDVFRALADQLGTGIFWQRLLETLEAALLGFAIAAALGVPLGLALGSSPLGYRSARGLLDFLRPIPPIAMLPLLVLTLGSGLEMKAAIVAFAALWPILFQALYAVQDVDPVARDTARAYGLGRRAVFLRVVLPSSLPYVATGMRLAVSIALIVTIAVELVAGTSGLGFEMNALRNADRVPDVYALVLVAGLLGVALTAAVRRLQSRLLHWHASEREQVV